MYALFWAVLRRDLRLAARRRTELLQPLAFFLVAASLFPLGVGPESQTLRQIAPGVLWVCALLAVMLSLPQVWAGDHADGSLEQLMLSPQPLTVVTAARACAHWLLQGLPLVCVAPLLGLMFGLTGPALLALCIGLLLGTPVLSLLGLLASALTLGLRSSGLLILLLVLPLVTPVLIFGAGAVVAVEAGLSPGGHYSLLGALVLLGTVALPGATAAALRIATA